MLRQARELFALPTGNKQKSGLEEGSKGSKLKEQKQNKSKKVAKVSKKSAASNTKVSKQFDNATQSKKLAPESMIATTGGMLDDQLEADINHRKRQNHSSSSGGSSSGYLSQAVGFQSNAEQASDETTLEDVAFTRQQSVAESPANRQNGLYEWQAAHQSGRPQLNSTLASMIDVRSQPQQHHHHHHHNEQQQRQSRQLGAGHSLQHLRVPGMVPMMIDDDDDDDDEDDDHDEGQLAVEDLEAEEEEEEIDVDEDLDVRQMLASHRERLRASKPDQLRQSRHNARYGGLIDSSPQSLNADDKLSRPGVAGQARPSLAQAQASMFMMSRNHRYHQLEQSSRLDEQHHANSHQHGDEHKFYGQHFDQHSGSANTVATLTRANQTLGHQYQPTSYLYGGQQYLNRVPAQHHHQHHHQHQQQQQQLQHNAAIYYQPNLIKSEHQQHQQQYHKTYERPRYLQSTSSFLYHQPYAATQQFNASLKQQQQQQQQQHHHHNHQLSAALKPVPPLPPHSNQRAHSSFDSNGQARGHARHHSESRIKMMQTSGSRQHLTSSAEHQQQHQHQHHSSSASSSPHARRNNLRQSAHMGSSQLSIAKQNLRSVPNRNTPTPSHLARTNGPPAGGQVLPGGDLSGAPGGATAPAPATAAGHSMSCCGKMAKFLLFIANALFWSAGIALTAWGILGLVDDHKYNLSQLLVFEPSTRMSLFQLLSWSFITLGCATVLVGFCGCSAMFKNSRWILGLYIFLILAIFALDLATGLLAIIFQERLVANVRLRLVNKLRTEYGTQASFTAAIDYIQTRYECCGLDGHFDYDQSLWRLQRLGGFEATVARTCCHLRNTFDDQAHVNPRPVNESMCQSTDVRFHQSYRYRRGCLDDLERLIRHKIWTFTIGCGAVGALVLLSLVFATCFCRSIPNGANSRKASSAAASATGSRVYHHQTAYLGAGGGKPKKLAATKHSSYR